MIIQQMFFVLNDINNFYMDDKIFVKQRFSTLLKKFINKPLTSKIADEIYYVLFQYLSEYSDSIHQNANNIKFYINYAYNEYDKIKIDVMNLHTLKLIELAFLPENDEEKFKESI
jgi:hypothetical protein